jgi:hypothetical protein
MASTFPGSVFRSDTYQSALNQWMRSRNPEHRALALNLSCDHRVTHDQEREFQSYFKSPYNGRALKKALTEYHKHRIRTPSPAFRSEAHLVADCQNDDGPCCVGFDRQVDLVSVLCLSKLRDVLNQARNEVRPEWLPLRYLELNNFDGWLEEQLLGRNRYSQELEDFIGAVLSVINYNMVVRGPFNPIWVTTWDKFEPVANALRSDGELNADRWIQSVGIKTIGPLWHIVLKYPARDAGFLYRPTQLDSGNYAYHFPSPLAAEKSDGGHPMDLARTSLRSPLFPEYIHEQIRLKIDYWKAAGCLIGRTSRDRYYLSVSRRKHYLKLKNTYTGIEEWMPRPI